MLLAQRGDGGSNGIARETEAITQQRGDVLIAAARHRRAKPIATPVAGSNVSAISYKTP